MKLSWYIFILCILASISCASTNKSKCLGQELIFKNGENVLATVNPKDPAYNAIRRYVYNNADIEWSKFDVFLGNLELTDATLGLRENIRTGTFTTTTYVWIECCSGGYGCQVRVPFSCESCTYKCDEAVSDFSPSEWLPFD